MNQIASFSMPAAAATVAASSDALLHPPRSMSTSPSMKNRITGPIRRGSITTSRNGNNSRLLGPFFCRWRGCRMMDHPFVTGDAIWRHMETEHFSVRSPSASGVTEASGGLSCGWIGCDEVRPSLFRLKSHMKKHLDWRPFGCELCDERFKHRGDQKKHLMRKHPDAPQHLTAARPRTPRIIEQDESQTKSNVHEFDHVSPIPTTTISPAYPVQPSFPAAIPPPPALSDYAFSSHMTSPSATSLSSAGAIPLTSYAYPSPCSSTQSASDLVNGQRDPLTTMMVSPGHLAFTPSFSNPAAAATYGLMSPASGLGLQYPTFSHHGTTSPVSESASHTMAGMLVNPKGKCVVRPCH
jgi:hypothetical protein